MSRERFLVSEADVTVGIDDVLLLLAKVAEVIALRRLY